MEVDNGNLQSSGGSLFPCSDIFPSKVIVTVLFLKIAVPPASQIEAIESRDLPKVGNTCAVLACTGRVGKYKVPLCVAVMVVFSGMITVGTEVVGLILSSGVSVHR